MSPTDHEPSFCFTTKDGRALAISAPPMTADEFVVNPKLMCVEAVISTPALDRQGEVLEPDGLVLDDDGQPEGYAHNPVVLYDHRASWPLPIGIAEGPDGRCTVRKSDNKWLSTNYFSQTCKFAENVFKLMDEGILRMWSVGFDPIDGTQIGMRPDGKHKAYRYRKWKLVEQSATPTAQNPEALTVFVQKSQPGALHPRLIESLKPFMLPGTPTLLIHSPVETKSMDPNPPDGAAAAPETPEPEQKEGKKVKPSGQKLLDCIQHCTDMMVAWSSGWDDIEHDEIMADVSDAIESLNEIREHLSGSLGMHHEIKAELPSVDLPGGEKKKPSEEEEESGGEKKPMGEKVEKADDEKKDEKEDYESKFKKSIVRTKGYNYAPQRAWLPPQGAVIAKVEPQLSKEEEAELKKEFSKLQRELRQAQRIKDRALSRTA